MSERGPLYQYIEFCRNAETLWRKLESGHWDWLGRKPDGQFVLGRPRREVGSQVGVPSVHSVEVGAQEGQHGVRIYAWSGQPGTRPGSAWFVTAARARATFEEQVRRLEDPKQNPILGKVVLIEHGQVTDERFMVQTPPPNYQ